MVGAGGRSHHAEGGVGGLGDPLREPMALRHVNEDENEDENVNEYEYEYEEEEETTVSTDDACHRQTFARRVRLPFRQKTEYSPGAHRVTSHATAYVSHDGHGHGSLRVGA
jgi:hypothetical protein